MPVLQSKLNNLFFFNFVCRFGFFFGIFILETVNYFADDFVDVINITLTLNFFLTYLLTAPAPIVPLALVYGEFAI